MFSRRWLINYVLIVLIIVFTYVGNRFDVKTGYQPPNRISRINPAEVAAIEIQIADESLRLRRSAAGWNLEAPLQWPANSVQVGRMLDIVNRESESRLDAAAVELDQLGLKLPRAMLRLDQTQILFGATNNIGERRYTMIGDEIFLLPDIHLPFISQGLTGVIDRRLIPRTLPLQSLRLPDFEFQRDADDVWQAAGATPAQIEQLVANWRDLEATRVAAFKAGATPRQKIRAQLDDGTRLEFFLMSIDPEIIIAHPRLGLQYHFNADRYYQLISIRRDENPA